MRVAAATASEDGTHWQATIRVAGQWVVWGHFTNIPAAQAAARARASWPAAELWPFGECCWCGHRHAATPSLCEVRGPRGGVCDCEKYVSYEPSPEEHADALFQKGKGASME